MAIKINYSKKTQNKQLSNVVLFTDEKFNISKIIKYTPLRVFLHKRLIKNQ